MNKLQFIIPNEKQRKQWDALVRASPQGNIYALSWYLDVITDGNWGIVTNEKITCGLPVAFKKRTGYKNVYQPFYSMFFDALGEGSIEDYLTVIEKDFHHLHITTQSSCGKLKKKERVRQEMIPHREFEKNYSENARRQIKKAEKNELQFGMHENAAEVVRLFKDNKGKELKEYKPADFTRLKNLIEAALEHKHGFCAHITEGKTVLASAVFLWFGNRAIFLKGGVNNEGKEKGAMYYLMHKAIENCMVLAYHDRSPYKLSKGQLIFDFGGSNNKNVADFYRKFGGKDVTYFEVEIDNRNLVQKVVSKLRK